MHTVPLLVILTGLVHRSISVGLPQECSAFPERYGRRINRNGRGKCPFDSVEQITGDNLCCDDPKGFLFENKKSYRWCDDMIDDMMCAKPVNSSYFSMIKKYEGKDCELRTVNGKTIQCGRRQLSEGKQNVMRLRIET